MQSHPGWFDVGGGKLTTYRLMAREVVDRMLKTTKRPGTACRTANEPLLDENQRLRGYSAIIPPALTEDAVRHYCENEWAQHLDDVMIRRTRWHYYLRDAQEIAEKVTGWMGETLGWDSRTRRQELDRYRAIED
jgi:glycerol-3-phosphate dehydrogenase